MDKVFDIVYKFLKWVSKVSGFTYHEINIIVYFIVIPLIFVFFIGKILKNKKIIIAIGFVFLIALLIIQDFEEFSTYLFNKSVSFLKWFSIIGLNYIQASVIICVLIPIIIITSLLIYRKN